MREVRGENQAALTHTKREKTAPGCPERPFKTPRSAIYMITKSWERTVLRPLEAARLAACSMYQ